MKNSDNKSHGRLLGAHFSSQIWPLEITTTCMSSYWEIMFLCNLGRLTFDLINRQSHFLVKPKPTMFPPLWLGGLRKDKPCAFYQGLERKVIGRRLQPAGPSEADSGFVVPAFWYLFTWVFCLLVSTVFTLCGRSLNLKIQSGPDFLSFCSRRWDWTAFGFIQGSS